MKYFMIALLLTVIGCSSNPPTPQPPPPNPPPPPAVKYTVQTLWSQAQGRCL